MSVAPLPGTLADLEAYVGGTRVFAGTTTARAEGEPGDVDEPGELETCLRMRVAAAGAAAARTAADVAALISLHDFLGRG